MKRLGLAAAALLLGMTMVTGSAFVPASVGEAQAQAPAKKSAKETRKERAAARASARAATRAKRADCRAQAKAQKLNIIRTERFVRACMRKKS